MKAGNVIKLFLVLIGFQLLISALFKFVGLHYEINKSLATVIGINLAILLTIVYYRRHLNISQLFYLKTVNIKSTLTVLFLAISSFFFLGLIDLLIIRLVPKYEILDKLIEDMRAESISSVLHILIFAPVMEELLFRGLILESLLKKYNRWRSIILCSLFFACFHLNPYALISTFIGSVIICLVYIRLNSIIFAIIFHFTFNLTVHIAYSNTVEYDSISYINLVSGIVGFASIILMLYIILHKSKRLI